MRSSFVRDRLVIARRLRWRLDLLEQALIFISAAVILVPIFQRLGMGSVLGYLIAGIIVGPHLMKLITDAEKILHFAELGVVFLLFLIGLEIQPRKLWSMRVHLFGLGGLQVLSGTVVFSAIGAAAGLSWVTAGVLGFALSLSSTAFALQTLTEKNQFNTEYGRSSFSVLLMQDLVAIPALAIIPLLGASTAGAPPSARKIILVILGAVGLFLASRHLVRPLFRLIASTRSREMFTAVTLLVVIGVASLTQAAGLSAALGTFLAGVLLADSEYRHELETDLEPFKSLLMGLFFIAVGMTVNLGLIASEPLIIAAMTLAYVIIKIALLYAVGRLFKLSHQTSKLMALTIAQGGEFAFVIFGISQRFDLANAEAIARLTIVITLSMALTPLILKAEEWLARRRNQLASKPEFDKIDDESPEVIIAGFGRFGQIFGRICRAQNIRFVAIDQDPDQIELVRRFGNKVYYGDAGRVDLLQAAGAAKAKYLVLAVDDVETSLRTARTVREHFPHIKIFARARNRGHTFDLLDLGITHVKRETLDSSLYFVRDLLVDRGMAADRATNLIEKFRRHDETMLIEQHKVRHDDKMMISVSKQAAIQLADVLREDETKSYL